MKFESLPRCWNDLKVVSLGRCPCEPEFNVDLAGFSCFYDYPLLPVVYWRKICSNGTGDELLSIAPLLPEMDGE